MLIHLIAAARPNFMKIAPLYHALKKEDWATPFIVHTGQHYDINMSDAFFTDLDLPDPDIHLGVGSGTHAEQTAKVMIAYEKVLLEHQPDLVIVVGDVNSTLACTLAATKVFYAQNGNTDSHSTMDNFRHRQIESSQFHPEIEKTKNSNKSCRSCQPTKATYEPHHSQFTIHNSRGRRPLVAHLEAGLRSFDRTMPEEINRLVTDSLADILWTPSPDGDENLIREGIAKERIVRVGNIMIDSLEMLRPKIEDQVVYEEFSVTQGSYGLVTLHRPSNVDDPKILAELSRKLIDIAWETPLIFPVHPRTRKNLIDFGLINNLEKAKGVYIVEPMNYIRFMNLVFNSHFIITDSGGIQEETTYLGIPCLTMRPNTERPITIDQGTNQLCTLENLENRTNDIISGNSKKHSTPELWDGQTADRVVESIKSIFT